MGVAEAVFGGNNFHCVRKTVEIESGAVRVYEPYRQCIVLIKAGNTRIVLGLEGLRQGDQRSIRHETNGIGGFHVGIAALRAEMTPNPGQEIEAKTNVNDPR